MGDGVEKFTRLYFRLGIPSRLVIFPDENHWVLDHGNRFLYLAYYGIDLLLIIPRSLKWHYEVLRWFDQYVGEHS